MYHVRKSLSAITMHLAIVAYCVKQPYCIHACCKSSYKDDVVHVLDVIQNPNDQHAVNIPNVLYNVL